MLIACVVWWELWYWPAPAALMVFAARLASFSDIEEHPRCSVTAVRRDEGRFDQPERR
jgi:hypothetical protein